MHCWRQMNDADPVTAQVACDSRVGGLMAATAISDQHGLRGPFGGLLMVDHFLSSIRI